MHILLLSSTFGGGGISSYAHELINCLYRKHDITIILGDDSTSRIDKKKAKVIYVDNDDLSISNASKLVCLINNQLKPDVVINSRSTIFPLIVPYLNNNIKAISISHSLKYVEADIAGFNSKYVDTVIALSKYGQRNLEKTYKKTKKKIVVVPNSVQKLNDSHSICKKKQDSKCISIVFPGGTNAPKTPEIVAQIVRKLLLTDLNFKFYWMGNTICPLSRISFLKDIRQLFDKDSRLIITGLISRQEATSYMTNANILLLPSRREGSSVSLLEAVRGGTIPIVADYNNSNKEVIEEFNCGYFVNHNDIDGFVYRISDVIRDNDSYATMYEKAIYDFENYMSYDIWLKSMSSITESKQLNHSARKRNFSKLLFKRDRILQSLVHKYHYYLSLLQESVPTAFSLSVLYFKHKYLKK